MVQQHAYINQLRELYDNYPGKELERLLGVSVRSIQNYLKTDDPTTPNKEVINNIREVYAKHEKGEPIKQSLQWQHKSLLEQSILNLTEDKLRNTAIMEKLADDKLKSTAIIESLVSIIRDKGLLDPNLPAPSKTAETLTGGKKSNSSQQ